MVYRLYKDTVFKSLVNYGAFLIMLLTIFFQYKESLKFKYLSYRKSIIVPTCSTGLFL